MLTIAFWYQQSSLADAKLRQSVDVRYERMAERLSTEVHAHLTAMRRFADFWGILGRPPQEDEWSTQAERYYRDFRYVLNISYITQSGEIARVYPQDSANMDLVGMKMLDSQRPNVEVLKRALEQRSEEQTGVMPLLQNIPGLIYYLPINSYQDGSPMGVAAMVVGLPLMADTLYHEGLFDKQRLYLGLWNDDEPLKEWQVRGQPGPWRVESNVVFGHTTLTLIAQPNRELLLSERSRQSSVSLAVGLVLAYLLYLVLFGRHQMTLQQRSVNRSNEELRREVRKRTQLQSEVEWLARHDELTGVPNRRHFMNTIEACTEQTPLCVLLCDIDHFKSVNDQLGHQAGDHALIHLANLGQQLTPEDGMFARYGGEEFVVMLPHTNEHRGMAIAELLREGVLNSGLEHADGRPVTISIGVAVHKNGTLVIADLLHQADLALYEAKHNGRNRVELAADNSDQISEPYPCRRSAKKFLSNREARLASTPPHTST